MFRLYHNPPELAQKIVDYDTLVLSKKGQCALTHSSIGNGCIAILPHIGRRGHLPVYGEIAVLPVSLAERELKIRKRILNQQTHKNLPINKELHRWQRIISKQNRTETCGAEEN